MTDPRDPRDPDADTDADADADTDTVELTVPADPAYVSVLRTVTASLAARRDFTLDEIDDLRIAVDEASALLLPLAGPGAQLTAVFGGSARELRVTVSISSPSSVSVAALDTSSFAWMVLAALTDSVETRTEVGRLALVLVKARGLRV